MLSSGVLRLLQKTASGRVSVCLFSRGVGACPSRAMSLLPAVATRRRVSDQVYHKQPSTIAHKFSSSNLSTDRNVAADDDEQKLSTLQKFKLTWKKYGMLTVVSYFTLYGCTLAGMFFALEVDLFSASSFGLDKAKLISSVKLIPTYCLDVVC